MPIMDEKDQNILEDNENDDEIGDLFFSHVGRIQVVVNRIAFLEGMVRGLKERLDRLDGIEKKAASS